MRLSRFCLLSLALACGGQAELDDSASPSVELGLEYAPDKDGVRVSGATVSMPDAAVAPEDVAVAVRWIITEELIAEARRTSGVRTTRAGSSVITFDIDEPPPPEALVANEATGRDGVAVGYVVAYVDVDDSGSLNDCLSASTCPDYLVGGSRNALVVHAEETWPATGDALLGFGCAAGARPAAGWSLVHLDAPSCSGRPTVRDWAATDSLELVVIGDFREKNWAEVRSVSPDVD
jgi:hypothetical protein